ncbi:protein EMBRYO DEFECTIVE 1674 [Vigna radiata var. radiata]|uniref:Protein EMBRYO DEFECTIVE 1674 n=1 Tax=Vigna radiata var. radiata TaxID=3916 RepID=A0A1S3TIJ6_VIGRR|nr:protein EMBRYO DEFECTIVE 1674 [Vigna radiata var. radiata]
MVVGGGDGGGGFKTTPVPPKAIVFLNQWWLVKQRNGLAVGGVASVGRDRERVFMSTVIAEREEANVVHTQDDTTIVFRGFVDTSRSSQSGVPLEVSQHFLVGFPYNWSTYSSIDNIEYESNNSEKGIPVESQANGKSSIGMYDSTGPSEKNIVRTQTSAKKKKAVRKNIGLDASRTVTRSISKNSQSMPKEDGKDPIANVFSQVRRSPRLNSCK